MSTIAVIAKACVPGRVKTRLTPPLTPREAAELAAVSLAQTMRAVRRVRGVRRILYLDGGSSGIDLEGFEVLPQSSGPLDARIAALFDAVSDRTMLIGMDTPQVDPSVLEAAVAAPADAWFGPASDGGFWALGLDAPRGALVLGVPMSRADSGNRQSARLRRAGLTVQTLPTLTDVDGFEDARAVARLVPATPFALAVGRLEAALHQAAIPPAELVGTGAAGWGSFPAS